MTGITGCWECLDVQLGVDQKNIDNITANNIQWPDLQEKAFQMFLAWHNKGISLTSEQLSAALIHVGRQDLAEKLEHQQVNGDHITCYYFSYPFSDLVLTLEVV